MLCLYLHMSLLRKQCAITFRLGTPSAFGRRRVMVIIKEATQRKPGNVHVLFKLCTVHILDGAVNMQHF